MVKITIQYTNGFFKSLLSVAMLWMITNSSVLAYELIDLGKNVVPRAINNFGVVVGSSNMDQSPTTAFRWSSDSGFDFIDGTSANAVNDEGQIAGSTITGAFILDGKNYRDWSGYGAFGINQWGEVAGYEVGINPYQPRSLPYNPSIFEGNKWVVFDIAGIYPRGTRQGVYADRFILNSVNADGYAVGYKYRYGIAGSAAILLDPNVAVKDRSDIFYLPTLSGGTAVDINDSNIVIGTTGSSSSTTPVTYSQAYSYDYNIDGLSILPLLDGGLRSNAFDINKHNQVVGSSEMLENSIKVVHAVLWDRTDGTIIDLNSLVAADSGWVLKSANAINDNGDIAGTGLMNGVEHGFVLTSGQYTGQPPVAVSSADVYSGKAPLMVNFDSLGSTDPDGTIIGYAWNFMDESSSTETNPSYEFTKSGSYTVTLTVTDDEGMQASSSITITARKGNRK